MPSDEEPRELNQADRTNSSAETGSSKQKHDEQKLFEGKFGSAPMSNWFTVFAIWLVFIVSGPWSGLRHVEHIPYSQFISELKQGQISEVQVSDKELSGKFSHPVKGSPEEFTTERVDPEFAKVLANYNVKFSQNDEHDFFRGVLSWLLPLLVIVGALSFMAQSAEKRAMSSGGMLGIGQSKARLHLEEKSDVLFKDVAGIEEAKEELMEVVGFLREPENYRRLGGRMPKGVLLIGPPGCGKTLLARAVAGEAGVPFFSISGSEFVEMFVGVGAARVRHLFEQASKKAPCIVFIDELDALGRARGYGPMAGGHDEKEQTLNQLLVELDGFDSRQGVILLAATNRPEVLDPALLRAGRFDRQVLVDKPDKKGRVQILKLHMKNIVLDKHIDVEIIASMTPGFTGADLANLTNEATLLAARRKASKVSMNDFSEGLERIIAGLEKKNRLLSERERRIVAYHEMGHALVAIVLPGTDPVQKVSIVARGIAALGYTMQRPSEDRYLMSRQDLLDRITVLLGGRAAELLVFNEISTGAADDLSKATEIARSMITKYGMNDKLGPITYETEPTMGFAKTPGLFAETRKFSEQTAREIDCAIKELIESSQSLASKIIRTNKDALERAAQKLLEKETLSREELLDLVGEVQTPPRVPPTHLHAPQREAS